MEYLLLQMKQLLAVGVLHILLAAGLDVGVIELQAAVVFQLLLQRPDDLYY